MAEISVTTICGDIIYVGTKEDLVAASIADEVDFPVWPKRTKTLPEAGGKASAWIKYRKGGLYEIRYVHLIPGAESLPFVSLVDWKLRYWPDEKAGGYRKYNPLEVLEGRQFCAALFLYLHRAGLNGISGASGQRLIEEIFKAMPEFSWRRFGFMDSLITAMTVSSGLLNLERWSRKLNLIQDELEAEEKKAA